MPTDLSQLSDAQLRHLERQHLPLSEWTDEELERQERALKSAAAAAKGSSPTLEAIGEAVRPQVELMREQDEFERTGAKVAAANLLETVPGPLAGGATLMTGFGAPAAAAMAGSAAALGRTLAKDVRGEAAPQELAEYLEPAAFGAAQAAGFAIPAVGRVTTPAFAARAPAAAQAIEIAAASGGAGLTGAGIDALYQASASGEIDWRQAAKAGGLAALIGGIGGGLRAHEVKQLAQADRDGLVQAARKLGFEGESFDELRAWHAEMEDARQILAKGRQQNARRAPAQPAEEGAPVPEGERPGLPANYSEGAAPAVAPDAPSPAAPSAPAAGQSPHVFRVDPGDAEAAAAVRPYVESGRAVVAPPVGPVDLRSLSDEQLDQLEQQVTKAAPVEAGPSEAPTDMPAAPQIAPASGELPTPPQKAKRVPKSKPPEGMMPPAPKRAVVKKTPTGVTVAPKPEAEVRISKLATAPAIRAQREFVAEAARKAATTAPAVPENSAFKKEFAAFEKAFATGRPAQVQAFAERAGLEYSITSNWYKNTPKVWEQVAKHRQEIVDGLALRFATEFVTIEVPDDGTYRVPMLKHTLKNFAAKVEKEFGYNLKATTPRTTLPKLKPSELDEYRVAGEEPKLPKKKSGGAAAAGDPGGAGEDMLADPVAAMPAIPPGVPSGLHSRGRMPVAMEPIMPGQVDTPAVMKALEDVVRALGGESPIRSGRFQAQASGVFFLKSKVIRLDQGDNIPTAAHEIGHALADRVFGSALSNPLLQAMRGSAEGRAAIAELRALGIALYGSRRPAAGYPAEGFAELVRLWLTTESAPVKVPLSYAWFEKQLLAANTPLAQALQVARDKIDIWRGQGAEGRARAQMKDAPGRLRQLRDFVRDKLSVAEQLEEFAPLEALASGFRKVTKRDLAPNENPYLLASAFRKSAGNTLETMVERGMVDLWGNVRGPGLKEALTRIKPEQAEKFAHYLWARRALERWARGKNPGLAKPDAEYLKAKLETPEFIDAASKYYAWWDGVLQYLEDAAPATNAPIVAAIRATSHDYVPLARDLDPLQVKAAAARAAGAGLYRMHGSGRPIKNIYLQSLLVAERLIARAHRDLVLDAVVNLSQHEGMGWLVEKVPLTRVMESVNIEKIRRELEGYGVDTSDIPEDTLLKYATHLDQPAGVDPIVARKTANGTEWYQIPADVHELLAGVEAPARLGWVFELLMGAPTRAFKLGTTGLRASFSLVTNPARDLPTFLLQSVAGNPASRAALWLKSLADIVRAGLGGKESPALELYHRLGISASNFLGGDIRQAQREAKSLFRGRVYRRFASPVESLREFFSFSEATPRVAELALYSKELGWQPGAKLTPAQAVLLRVAAKRVTTDFAAAGKSGREINRAIPFYNAAVQGARSFGRAMRGDRDTGRQRRFATLRAILNGLALLTMPALYNWWRNKDEEWYQMLPWRERYLYLNIKGAAGKVYQVPLPPEWGSLFATLPEALLDSWYRKDPRGVTEAFKHVFDVVNPLDWPVLAAAAKEQWQNRVEFFDRPIVPRGELDLRPGDQRSTYSSWLAKTLGDVFPDHVSPRRFDAAVREVFGGAGADLVEAPTTLMRALGLQVMEKERETEAADIPIFGRVARRGGQYSAANQRLIDFWDDRDRYSALIASNRKAIAEGRRDVSPVSFAEQRYAQRLEITYPAIRMALEIAARTPELAKRQALYRRAADHAARVLELRPKE
jgi:hypothetical protein